MRTVESTTEHEQESPRDAGADAARLPRRIARKAEGPTSSAPARVALPDAPWSFGNAVNAGIHTPIARAATGGEVSGGAHAAVSQAASSTGSSLPATLQRKFESSLGVDLSGVRVHTGEASARATGAVSARAYASGQDIHFNAGQYDPSSASGQHLIAHEVAHTVQQRGASAGPQYKLEVSSPGDHSETEADHAADAMVRGAPAQVTGAPTGLGRAIMRTPSTDLAHAADRGESVERDALMLAPPEVGTVTNVQDVAQAQRAYNEIEHDLPLLEQGNNVGNSYLNDALGVPNGVVTSEQINQTEHARNALSTFLASAGEQSRELGDYQRQYQQCIVDFARIQAMIEQLQATHPEIAGATNAAEARMMGDQVVQAVSGRSVGEMAERTRSAATRPGAAVLNASFNDYRERRTDLDAVAGEIGTRQHQAASQTHAVLAAINNLQAGPTTREEAGAEARGRLAGVRAECERVKTWIRRVSGAASSRAQALMTGAGVPGAMVAAAAEHGGAVADFLVDSAYAQQLQSLDTAISRAGARQDDHAMGALVQGVRTAMEAWHANLRALMSALERMQTLRNELRTSTDMMSRSADASGHRDTAVIIRLTGECDVFLAQTRATIGLGEAEQASATYATTDRGSVEAMTYYAAYQTYTHGQLTYMPVERRLTIMQGFSEGSTEGRHGANPVVDRSLIELRRYHGIVQGFHGRLATAAGLGDTAVRPETGSAAPTLRSATGDPTVQSF